MNTPNPLTPQGSFQEQSRRKSQVRLIVFSILAIHVVLLGVLLIQGCKREETPPPTPEPTLPPTTPFVETNLPPPPPPPLPDTNFTPPPTPSNVFVPPPPVVPSNLVEPPPPVTPETSAPPTASETGVEYVIKKGDTFSDLAKKYGVSVRAIMRANPGVDPAKLKINQKITIPPKPPGGLNSLNSAKSPKPQPNLAPGDKLYVVKRGDNLTKIAHAHGTSVHAIRQANHLRTDQIRVNQKLIIPSKTASEPGTRTNTHTATTPPAAPSFPATPAPVGSH